MKAGAITVLAEHLQHPEGPALLDDGDIVFVETWASRVMAYRSGAGLRTYAVTYGGPNACALGSDGCVYVTQLGGVWRGWRAERMAMPGIQRIHPDGRVETVIERVSGIQCTAPNDLCFGTDGRLYFTDPGLWIGAPDHGPGYVFAIDAEGRGEVLAELDKEAFPNGIAADPQGGVVWDETGARQVKRWRPGRPVETLATLPKGHLGDGLKFDARGRLWIATVYRGGFDVLDPATGAMQFVPCPHYPLNCIFKGEALIVTDRGLWDNARGDASLEGRLLEFDVGVGAPPLPRGQL